MSLIHNCSKLCLPVIILAAWANLAAAQKTELKVQAQQDELSGLIDKLQGIADEDIGYMPTRSGNGFLPLGTSDPGAMLLGQRPPSSSDTMREIIVRGAKAVPQLIAHLDDNRPTKITIKHDFGFGGMFFSDEYDYNSRTIKEPPDGVNRDWGFGENHPKSHTVTIGDLCFVALGQIVNRHFSAVRYQPTACVMINSPTYSEPLRKAIRKEWGNLTSEQHKESLVRDFLEPDSEYRRSSASLRLGYYYPEALEPLVLKQLAEPRYNVFVVERLIREKLYLAKNAKERKWLVDTFVAEQGPVAHQGILVYLFKDLDTQEAAEEGRTSPSFKDKYAARACLVEIFGYPTTVKSKDRPKIMPLENCTQARFIDTLINFPSPKIDQAVQEVLRSTEELYLAEACAKYLAGRGADAEIRQDIEQRLKRAKEKERQQLEHMRQRLGWGALHSAVEEDALDRIEKAILKGDDINSQLGLTPARIRQLRRE